jgi:hypothetical protein
MFMYETVEQYDDAIQRVQERNRQDRKEWLLSRTRVESRDLDPTNLDTVRAHVDRRDAAFLERLQTERKNLQERSDS